MSTLTIKQSLSLSFSPSSHLPNIYDIFTTDTRGDLDASRRDVEGIVAGGGGGEEGDFLYEERLKSRRRMSAARVDSIQDGWVGNEEGWVEVEFTRNDAASNSTRREKKEEAKSTS